MVSFTLRTENKEVKRRIGSLVNCYRSLYPDGPVLLVASKSMLYLH